VKRFRAKLHTIAELYGKPVLEVEMLLWAEDLTHADSDAWGRMNGTTVLSFVLDEIVEIDSEEGDEGDNPKH
jgi:hypothetical protein